MTVRSIEPTSRPLNASIALPGSKSLSNRALIAAAMAQGYTVLSGLQFSEDTHCMIAGLRALGVSIEVDEVGQRVELTGIAGHLPELEVAIDCGESGTMLRLLTAICATSVGRYELSGRGRLHERPMGPLIDALRRQGTRVECLDRENCAPVVVHGNRLRGGELHIDSSQSSQFMSALMLAAPCASRDVMLKALGDPVSRPYINLTAEVLDHFGIGVIHNDNAVIIPAPQHYQAKHLIVEPDASHASYFAAAAAVCGGRVAIEGLTRSSTQGDVYFFKILEEMGCRILDQQSVTISRDPDKQLHGGRWDMSQCPDIVPTLAAVALFAQEPVVMEGVANLRLKESDRIAALEDVLSALGARVETSDNTLTVNPLIQTRGTQLNSHDDHRIAMSMAIVGLKIADISIANADCVRKSFPDFFATLQHLYNDSGT